jgi:hypothetical protein
MELRNMVVVFIQTWWPHGLSEEVGKAYIEVMKKYPVDKSLYKPTLSACVRATGDGFKGIAVDEIKDGKFNEAMDLIYRRMLMFGNLVKDLRYEVEVYMSGVEAMPMVGLKMPE